MPLSSVDALSDDEVHGTCPRPRPKRRFGLRQPAVGRMVRAKIGKAHVGTSDPKRLANLIGGNCGCKAGCFVDFRSHEKTVQEWLNLRKYMAKMSRLEHDKYVRVSVVFIVHLLDSD